MTLLSALLSDVKENDLEASHLSASSLRMILDNHHPIRRLGNEVAHNASDAEKRFALESNVDNLPQWMRADFGAVYDYMLNGTSA